MHGGDAVRCSYQHSRLACYTRLIVPASARPVGPGSWADRRSAPDNPVRGAIPPHVPGWSSPWRGSSCFWIRPG